MTFIVGFADNKPKHIFSIEKSGLNKKIISHTKQAFKKRIYCVHPEFILCGSYSWWIVSCWLLHFVIFVPSSLRLYSKIPEIRKEKKRLYSI